MKKPLLLSALLSLTLGVGGYAQSQDSALIDALVRKKILTAKEAESIRADVVKENVSAEKIKLSGPLTELALYGDVRERYQWDNVDPQFDAKAPNGDPGHGNQRSRWRFRLRLNADFKLADNWFGGVQLQTANTSDSGNQTYDGGFQNYNIYISRAFVGWNAADWLTFIAGKQANPFYTTELVWDPDINPSGLVEQVRFHKLFSVGGQEAEGYTKDGKSIASSKAVVEESPWELTLNAGQFIFDDNNEYLADSDSNTDAYLFVEQLQFSYKFSKDVKFTIAPAYLTYTASQVNSVQNSQGFAQNVNGKDTDVPEGLGETRDLSIIQVPGDITFNLAGQRIKLLWDSAYNTAGSKRVHDIYGVADHSSRDDLAFLAGFQIGENKKKGDWSLLVNYRQVGLAAVDPNLNDSDFGLSRVNIRGWKGGVAYNFTDSVVLALTYMNADNLRKNLVGGEATNDTKLADANSVQVLQVDLNLKF
ncbi:MAG: putative porin [Verrucomicrobiota bacterium]